MVRANGVERLASTADRRHKHLYLTETGAELLRQADKLVSKHEKRVCTPFTAREKQTLMNLLARFEG